MTDQLAAIEARAMAGVVKEAAQAIFNIRDDAYDMDEWDDLDSTDREMFECQASAALESANPVLLALVRKQAAQIERVLDLANTRSRCGWQISADEIRKALAATEGAQ
jgi:hypothetical protein